MSVFVLTDGTVVTDQTLAKSTPVTIQCSEPYAQMFKQVHTQACELWDSAALCKRKSGWGLVWWGSVGFSGV